MDLPQAVSWYTHLAKQPGWKEYVWHRVKEMARDWPAMYADLPDLLAAEMKQRNASEDHSDSHH